MLKRKVLLVILLLIVSAAVFAQEMAQQVAQEAVVQEVAQQAAALSEGETGSATSSVWKYFAAALAVGISCIAGGMAVGRIGTAAMGAMSENADLSGKALPYAGLAEGICLWGFLVALLILIL